MKLSCNVIEDMLPMYHDGVCSAETARLVEAHLQQCPSCNNMLAQMHAELNVPSIPIDDTKPLKELQKQWKKSELSWIKKGVLITLAALLFVICVSTGIWYFSYAKNYWAMTETMERTSEEDAFYTSSDYLLQKDTYRFEVWLPKLLSNSGFARVMGEDGLVLFLYPEIGEKCTFKLLITDENNQTWSVYLNAEMMPDFENHQFPVRTDGEKAHIRALIEKHSEAIKAMLDAVEGQWGISLETESR